jgi:hypothetical protein
MPLSEKPGILPPDGFGGLLLFGFKTSKTTGLIEFYF